MTLFWMWRCSSQFAEDFKAAQGFGWGATQPPLDLKALISRKVGWCMA